MTPLYRFPALRNCVPRFYHVNCLLSRKNWQNTRSKKKFYFLHIETEHNNAKCQCQMRASSSSSSFVCQLQITKYTNRLAIILRKIMNRLPFGICECECEIYHMRLFDGFTFFWRKWIIDSPQVSGTIVARTVKWFIHLYVRRTCAMHIMNYWILFASPQAVAHRPQRENRTLAAEQIKISNRKTNNNKTQSKWATTVRSMIHTIFTSRGAGRLCALVCMVVCVQLCFHLRNDQHWRTAASVV